MQENLKILMLFSKQLMEAITTYQRGSQNQREKPRLLVHQRFQAANHLLRMLLMKIPLKHHNAGKPRNPDAILKAADGSDDDILPKRVPKNNTKVVSTKSRSDVEVVEKSKKEMVMSPSLS